MHRYRKNLYVLVHLPRGDHAVPRHNSPVTWESPFAHAARATGAVRAQSARDFKHDSTNAGIRRAEEG